jgi:DNA repair exonuclease SbcCD ATPase subunit
LDDLKEEIENLKHKLSTIKNNEKILKRLYEQKERDLLSLAGENSKKIKEINEKLDRLNSDAIELQEAVVAGKHLAMGLRNSLVNLEKASRLGTWDMFGGGFFIDMMKHSHIDQAKRNLEDLKYLSDRFTRELKDVNITLDMNINISGFLSFSDWFFDGFFVDMFVKKRIDEARVKLEEQIRQVEAVLEDIKNKHDKGMSEISHLNETKMNLLF